MLLNGRRWVLQEDEEISFEGAHRRVGDLVQHMRDMQKDGDTRKIALSEIPQFLQKRSLPELFNLLPVAFANHQANFVKALHGLAVSCFNIHGDAALSKAVLCLCRGFTCRSAEVSEQLEKDFKVIEKIIVAAVDRGRLLKYLKESNGAPVEAETPEEEHVLAEIAAAGLARKEDGAYVYTGSKRYNPWRLIVAIPVCVLIGYGIISSIVDSSQSKKNPASANTGPRSSAPATPDFSPFFSPTKPPSDSRSVERTFGNGKAELDSLKRELDRDDQVIDREKAKAERMAKELKTLDREIEQERDEIDIDRIGLDRENQFMIDEFNRKVNSHNRKVAAHKQLLEELRAQDRLVKELIKDYNRRVDSYNEKIRRSRQ